MTKFEVEKRLAEELGSYVHINSTRKEALYTEEDYQQLKAFFIEMGKKYGGDKK